jgi:hypothetical protein
MDWNEWGRLTRFMESARISFQREARLWRSLELQRPEEIKVHVNDDKSYYAVTLEQHCQAVNDEWLLLGLVLVASYALAESAAAEKLGLTNITDVGGVENWSQRLLDGAGSKWADVKDGKRGAVEVAVIRNAIAHGERTYSQAAVNRLSSAEITNIQVGDPIVLTHTTLKDYRARLKSLLRAGGI